MPITGIDFSKLSLQEALDLAVLIEEEARDRYEELADQLEAHHTHAAGAFFRKMVRVEELHRTELQKRRQQLFGESHAKVSRASLFDVEAPEYDVARAGMSHREALEAAMVSEVKAHDFFAKAIPQVKDPEVKKLFEELRKEEVEHQEWIKLELGKLPATKDVPGDQSDEPVAH
jgi:rubrerythrin